MMEEMGLFSFHPLSHSYDLESFPSGHSTTSGALWMGLAGDRSGHGLG